MKENCFHFLQTLIQYVKYNKEIIYYEGKNFNWKNLHEINKTKSNPKIINSWWKFVTVLEISYPSQSNDYSH